MEEKCCYTSFVALLILLSTKSFTTDLNLLAGGKHLKVKDGTGSRKGFTVWFLTRTCLTLGTMCADASKQPWRTSLSHEQLILEGVCYNIKNLSKDIDLYFFSSILCTLMFHLWKLSEKNGAFRNRCQCNHNHIDINIWMSKFTLTPI